jgi:hypothetical protein
VGWADEYISGKTPLFHMSTSRRFRIDPEFRPYLARGAGRPMPDPALFVTDNILFWVPWICGKNRNVYVAHVVLGRDIVPCDNQWRPTGIYEFCPYIEPHEFVIEGSGLAKCGVSELLPLEEHLDKWSKTGTQDGFPEYLLDFWECRSMSKLRSRFKRETGARTFDDALKWFRLKWFR